MPSPAQTQVLDALRELSPRGPVTVAAIVAEVTRRGFQTTDALGVPHRVRTILQRLKELGLVAYLGPNAWRDLAAEREDADDEAEGEGAGEPTSA